MPSYDTLVKVIAGIGLIVWWAYRVGNERLKRRLLMRQLSRLQDAAED